MITVTINDKGQITIPSKIRKSLNLESGSQVRLFSDVKTGNLLLSKTSSIADAFGLLPKPREAITIENMDRTVRSKISKNVADR